ncbi:CAP domain-containing protein [uncultured Jatrophihabitans sp.]|uniref:CAP domain-containing protein n=1 Tax=uncultured Jatrophihabitans sp. TaxID=1610747 RepID=UPI0035CA066F
MFASVTDTGTRAHRTTVFAAFAIVIALFAALLHPASAEARTALPRRTTTEVSVSNAVAKLLNAERAAHHLKPVAVRTQLISSARSHNLAMSRTNTMTHQARGEAALGSRITSTGYKWTWAGENVGWNSQMTTAGVLMLQKAMYNEQPPNDGHRQNILNSHFTNVGVDVYLDAANHKVWLTVDFGRP